MSAVQIVSAGTNIKPKTGRPTKIPMGRITVVKGDHGVGKTRWEQALAFAVRGVARDTAFRPGREGKEGGILLRLTRPTESSLWAALDLRCGDQETTYQRVSKITVDKKDGSLSAGRPSTAALPFGIDPDRVLPIPDIEENLRKSPDAIRAIYLDKIVPPLSPSQAEAAMKEVKSLLEEEGLPVPTSLEGIRALTTQVNLRINASRSKAELCSGAISVGETKLPERPDPRRERYQRAMVAYVTLYLQTRGGAEGKGMVALREEVANMKANKDLLAPDPGPVPTPPQAPVAPTAPPPAAKSKAVALPANPFTTIVAIQEQVAKTLGTAAPCPVCTTTPVPIAPFAASMTNNLRLKQQYDGLLANPPVPVDAPDPAQVAYERALQAYQEAQAAYTGKQKEYAETVRLWADRSSRRAQVDAEIARVEGQIAGLQGVAASIQGAQKEIASAIEALGDEVNVILGDNPLEVLTLLQSSPPVATVTTLLQSLQEKLDSETQAGTLWKAHEENKKELDLTRKALGRLTQIQTHLENAVFSLVDGAKGAFLARMAKYMPPGWEPMLTLTDERGSDTFQFAVRVDGEVNYDPSGIQSLLLLFAFALVLFEQNPTPLMILCGATEHHFSKKGIPLAVKALEDIPAGVHVLLTTTEDVPAALKKQPGVVVVDLDAMAKPTET